MLTCSLDELRDDFPEDFSLPLLSSALMDFAVVARFQGR